MNPTDDPAEDTDAEDILSPAGGRGGGFGNSGQAPFAETDRTRFNLEKTKNALFAQIEDNSSAHFKNFFKSSLMDRFLHTAILYFVALFQLESLISEERGTKADHAALKREMECYIQDLSPIYAMIIMQESDYHHTAQDKKFFEQLYETATEILLQAFPGSHRQQKVEQELGRILRTNQFNPRAERRQNKGHISESTMSVRELYALKFEGDPSLNARVLANLYQRKPSDGGVTLASVSNSPLVGKIICPEVQMGESLRERMPWKVSQRGPCYERPVTASEEARHGFLSYKGDWELSDRMSLADADDMTQCDTFDDGPHRATGSSRPSSVSSAASNAGDLGGLGHAMPRGGGLRARRSSQAVRYRMAQTPREAKAR
eukprot:CAMPEP_0118928128 /NCGR_PEP_ID=MMETSP1169-20130426/5455_1 /TAXON_ID=36882 /ORGANISM="Pyramimonas obovata, Strain CCMP722" /LENGTH=374 /DNA_ID=CAMNT_0006870037 /DNA_START=121 /DNA_END=1241 /DNA_ORIENTATION=-